MCALDAHKHILCICLYILYVYYKQKLYYDLKVLECMYKTREILCYLKGDFISFQLPS